MSLSFETMTGLERLLTICALVGGGLFIVKTLLQFISGIGDVDVGGHDFDGHHDVGGHHDSDISFKMLSVHGLTAFVMMFGLSGLALLKSGIPGFITIGIAAVVGVFTMWVIVKLFQLMIRLQSSGNLDLNDAIGQEGEVYLRIPADGVGKVRVNIADRMRVLDAVPAGDEGFETGDQVWVIDVVEENVLKVDRVLKASQINT